VVELVDTPPFYALVAELEYAYASGAYAARLVGSNPTEGTKKRAGAKARESSILSVRTDLCLKNNLV
jgi:hypothetical protein